MLILCTKKKNEIKNIPYDYQDNDVLSQGGAVAALDGLVSLKNDDHKRRS